MLLSVRGFAMVCLAPVRGYIQNSKMGGNVNQIVETEINIFLIDRKG
jgi:hypothetical protein